MQHRHLTACCPARTLEQPLALRRAALVMGLALALGLACAPRAAHSAVHSGAVSGTWTLADSPHVLASDVFVPNEEALVIDAGVVVLAQPGVEFRVDGRLTTLGESQRPVRFQADGFNPFPGSWLGLDLQGSGPHVISFTSVSEATTGLTVRAGSELLLKSSAVTACQNDGVLFEPTSRGVVTGSLFAGNGRAGILLQDANPSIMDCDFIGNENAIEIVGNSFPVLRNLAAGQHQRFDGVLVAATSPLTSSGTWHDGGLAYVVGEGGTLEVGLGATLFLTPGLALKFATGAGLTIAGELVTGGNVDNPTVLTHVADDDAAGDTNGDGTLTQPRKGDWRGATVAPGALATFAEASIRFAVDGIDVESGGTAVLTATEVGNCLSHGVVFQAGGAGSVEGCAVHDNDIGVGVSTPSSVSLGRALSDPVPAGANVFTCNITVDVSNRDGAILMALRNFWGSPPSVAVTAGPVDAGDYLVSEPDAIAMQRILEVRHANTDDLLFLWTHASTCARTIVLTSDRPDTGFIDLSGSQTPDSALVPGEAALTGQSIRFYKLLLEL